MRSSTIPRTSTHAAAAVVPLADLLRPVLLRRAGQSRGLQLHQRVGSKTDHLAQGIGIPTLFIQSDIEIRALPQIVLTLIRTLHFVEGAADASIAGISPAGSCALA
jgi:hypothetical protein